MFLVTHEIGDVEAIDKRIDLSLSNDISTDSDDDTFMKSPFLLNGMKEFFIVFGIYFDILF